MDEGNSEPVQPVGETPLAQEGPELAAANVEINENAKLSSEHEDNGVEKTEPPSEKSDAANEYNFVLPSDDKLSEAARNKLLDSPNSETEEVIYSSLPPDLNVQVMSRATSTPTTGSKLLVKKADGKLKITFHGDQPPHALLRDKVMPCIACQRPIASDELYLNFPDDLDRRRLWGNALGFKYNEILRLKAATGFSITSIGHICTDHFSDECYRKYNFNKAAIESFGMPITVGASNPNTPVKKRTPWECSVCSFRCYSVFEMHTHLSEHASKGKEDTKVRDILQGKGITCPFCRRCTYGYKTLSGLQRHLQVEPTSHFYLKRIHEVSVKNCRSACLTPVNEWSSWTENNVFYAYHGCDVPVRSPTKRPLDSPSTPQPDAKKARGDSDELEKSRKSEKISTVARKLYASLEKDPVIMEAIEKRQGAGVEATIEMSPMYAARVKALLPNESVVEAEAQDDFVVGNPHNLAQALRLVTEEDCDSEELIVTTTLSPHIASRIERQIVSKQRKTARQLESNEARLRLFGDGDVPRGYKKVDGPDGPRLVPAQEKKSWRERFAPDVQIRNRRFLPLN